MIIAMSQSELIQHLYDQINQQNAMYLGIIGLILAAFAYLQWKLSDRQIKSIKNDILNEIMKSSRSDYDKILEKVNMQGIEIENKFSKLRLKSVNRSYDLISLLSFSKDKEMKKVFFLLEYVK